MVSSGITSVCVAIYVVHWTQLSSSLHFKHACMGQHVFLCPATSHRGCSSCGRAGAGAPSRAFKAQLDMLQTAEGVARSPL